jgi:hypothetical protein
MQRREFLAASAAAAASVAAGSVLAADAAPSGRQLIELRTYHFASPQRLAAYEQFLGEAAIPAFGRAGVGPVGAFKLLAKDNPDLKLSDDGTDLYVLLPHESMDSFLALERTLAADEAYQRAGRPVIASDKSAPAYTRYETSLLLGFEQCPRLQVPTKSPSRVVQLRTYESHNEERARRKIHMFNEGGEIAIFRRVGMNPVFFGQALAGPRLPNLTYMLAFDDDAAMAKGWNGFRTDADWNRLKNDESYKDTVSTISNLILRPIVGSQV